MSSDKKLVERYMASMSAMDRPAVVALLTDDVDWTIVTAGERMRGKREFENNIGDPATMGTVRIDITRLTEENSVVVSEGIVRVSKTDGGPVIYQFWDVFEFEATKSKRLTTFSATVRPAA